MRIVACALALAACTTSTTNQTHPDLAMPSDDLAVADDLASARDLARVMDLAGRDLFGRDLSMPDSSTPAPDLNLPPAPGQCWDDSHCPNGTCAVEAVGGICNGCGIPMDDCPADYDVCAPGAVCSTGCTTEDDCPQPSVQSCVISGSDYFCAQKFCSPGDCGPLHECRGGFCKRYLCPSGSGCPAGTTCRGTSTKVCVEDHLTFG